MAAKWGSLGKRNGRLPRARLVLRRNTIKMATNSQSIISEDAVLERMRTYIAPDPSARNPRVSTNFSHAWRIEVGYEANEHATWGFVTYRTFCDNGAGGTEFMRRLKWWTTDTMEFYNGQDVLGRMSWTTINDREQFTYADVAAVRSHFCAWTESAIQSEQPSKADETQPSMGRSHATNTVCSSMRKCSNSPCMTLRHHQNLTETDKGGLNSLTRIRYLEARIRSLLEGSQIPMCMSPSTASRKRTLNGSNLVFQAS